MASSAIRTFRATGTIGCSCGAETSGPPAGGTASTHGGWSPWTARGPRFELSAVYRLVAAVRSSAAGRAEADNRHNTEATAITPPILRSPNVTVRPLSASTFLPRRPLPYPQDGATPPEFSPPLLPGRCGRG